MAIMAMIERSAVAAVITNPRLPDNPIIACNPAFEALTGYARDEVLGRNCCFLAGPREERLLVAELKVAVAEKRPLLAQISNFKKDGTPFENALLIVPIFDEAGRLIYFLGSQAEVLGEPASQALQASAASCLRLAPLTRRQEQVLSCMVAGKRNKAIAQQLGISERTVKMHRAAMLAALGVGSSAEAIRLAVEAGWHLARPPGDRIA